MTAKVDERRNGQDRNGLGAKPASAVTPKAAFALTYRLLDYPTASEIGRKGAESLKTKLRTPIRSKTDEMRTNLGWKPGPWSEG